MKDVIIDDLSNIGDRWDYGTSLPAESDPVNQDALNLMFDSFFQAGVFISIPSGVSSEIPIYINSINDTPQGAMFYQNFFHTIDNNLYDLMLFYLNHHLKGMDNTIVLRNHHILQCV